MRIKSTAIPPYLRSSGLYVSLSGDNDNGDGCAIGSKREEGVYNMILRNAVYKPSLEMRSVQDLLILLNTMHFWGVRCVPFELIDFLMTFDVNEITAGLLSLRHEFPFVAEILHIRECPDALRMSIAFRLDMRLEIVSYLSDRFQALSRYPDEYINIAAENGSLTLLKYAHEQGCPWRSNTCYLLARNNSLQCLQYAHEHGCDWDMDVSTVAAENGHLDLLRYLHERGCPWNRDTCRAAADNGHLDCLMYVHEQHCSWDKDITKAAAVKGRLNCFAYAYEHGCPVDKNIIRLIAGYGHLSLLQYIQSRDGLSDSGICVAAASNNRLE